ncbi:cytidine deaminase [Filimonas effusa]|uniref:Cytidine deaminase n=1 Tax=Filimonas effusa TaxID=2508721 RepID=A0A4Q1DAQ0_9BACT|nr:cytidine deaminase [Filimonas effusa]RXK85559.1 cytidine deaminase [Filimonas effusa]
MNKQLVFEFEEYNSISELNTDDAQLLQQAREATGTAYAPYSNFRVAAAALLENGKVLTATNQENASYPAGICAERALLATVGALFPGMPIITMAISYHNVNNGSSDQPVSPCGICRQTLMEYEGRTHKPIRIVLSGMEGKVYLVKEANMLLPLGFTSKDL